MNELLTQDTSKAIAIYNNAHTVSQRPLTQGDAIRRRGYAQFTLSHFQDALNDYNLADQLFETLRSQVGQRRRLDMQPLIAKANLELGRFDTAANLFNVIVQRASASSDKHGTAPALVGLAAAKFGQEDIGGAVEIAVKAGDMYDSLGISNPDLWLVRARFAAAKSDFDQADTLVNQAIREYRNVVDKRGIATALRYAGDFRAARRQVKAS